MPNFESAIKKISFKEAKSLMDTDSSITVADVREENEYITGHVNGAINLPLSQLADVSEDEGKCFAEYMIPSKDAPLLVYCRTGKRSAEAAKILEKFGYKDIRDIGSLVSWPYGIDTD